MPPDGYKQGIHLGSICPDFTTEVFNTYEWMPHNSSSNRLGLNLFGSCIFDPWNAREFCSVMQHMGMTSLAIVGDSLSWEHYSSLLMSLGLHSDPNDQFVSRRSGKSIIRMGCQDTLKLIYRRSDDLKLLPSVIQDENPQMFIVNKGSHPEHNEVYEAGWNQSINALEEHERNLAQLGLPSLVLFRTTVPGHPLCASYTEPVNNITQMEAAIADKSLYSMKQMLQYRWWTFKAQNEIMSNLVTASRLRNYHIMDAYDINILRPDRHRPPDCLHNCFPGKTEVYHQLMLHFLKVSAHSAHSSASSIVQIRENNTKER